MRGLVSYLKKSRVALAALGVLTAVAATTAVPGAARADWDGHRGGGHGDRGRGDHDRGDHWRGDRGDHWRGEWRREAWRDYRWRPHYRPAPVYYPGYYDYYEPGYVYYGEPGVSLGFTFR